MWIEKIALSNFRNLTKQVILFDRKVNLFIGDNAQGKTNIIEGIYLLATTKSFRANKDAELIRWGFDEALVKGLAGPNEISILINRQGKKTFVNNKVKNKAFIIGVLPVVLFSPESLSIVSGAPERRRRFLDQLLSITDKKYLHTLSRYLRIIKNRNRLLWLIKQGRGRDLTVWNKQLVNLGSLLWSHRLSFAEAANPLLKSIGSRLIGSPVQLQYSPFSSRVKDEKEIKKRLESELLRRESEDVDKGITTFGPHRDDFKIVFDIFRGERILEKEIGIFGSRGEQRIATLALKLLEVEFIEKNLGERPVLLLDDVLSEFDRKNREHIIKLLPKQQSIVTSTSADLFPKELLSKIRIFEVKEGVVKKTEGGA